MLHIKQLPAWEDNYIFIVHNQKQAVIVDPTEAKPVQDFLEDEKLEAIAIINTHHHPDHIGGNLELKKLYNLDIYCSAYDKNRVPGAEYFLNPGDKINLLDSEIEIMDLSGHTLGLIGYYFPNQEAIFSGDCIFSLGCGYVFEGTYKQAQQALERITRLPDNTKIYCSHEYTLSNAQFQKSFDDSTGFKKVFDEIKNIREKKLFTVPTKLSFEKKWNAFLRWDDEELKKKLGIENLSPDEYFEFLRKQKNQF